MIETIGQQNNEKERDFNKLVLYSTTKNDDNLKTTRTLDTKQDGFAFNAPVIQIEDENGKINDVKIQIQTNPDEITLV